MKYSKKAKFLNKKVIGFILFVASISTSISVYAMTNLGNLKYWFDYQDSRIYRWDTNTVNIYVEKMSNDTNFQYITAMNASETMWDNALSLNLNSVYNLETSCNYYGGTVERLNSLGLYTISEGDLGWTVPFYTKEGYWMYGNDVKEGFKYDSVYAGVLLNTDYTALLTTCIHELGHGMGWSKHSSYNGDIMYPALTPNNSLSSRDIYHVEQLYHNHTGNSINGGGCYTQPVYHSHDGNSSSNGGCFTVPVYHTHSGSSLDGLGCYTVPIYHSHASTCYTTHSGFTSSSAKTTSSCPRCSSTIANAIVTYRCPTCGYTFGSFLFCTSCGYNGTHPTTSHQVYSCGKTTSSIDSYNPGCGKTTNTIIYYNPGCGKSTSTLDHYILACPYN